MAGIKRAPRFEAGQGFFDRYHAMSKATWADLYADLYRQTHGEESTDAEIIDDAERRADILGLRRAKG